MTAPMHNYLTHAGESIAYLNKLSRDPLLHTYPEQKQMLERRARYDEMYLAVADSAPVFTLPDGGRLLDAPLSELQPPLRLPMPTVVLEYCVPGSSANIVVASEHPDASCVHAYKFFRRHNSTQWEGLGECLRIQWEDSGAHIYLEEDEPKNEVTKEWVQRNWDAGVYASVGAVVAGFILALQCSNVTYDVVQPSERLNAARAKNGKTLFRPYHVLYVGSSGASSLPAERGSHASPRQHLRRGHIRTYQDGKRIWVRNCVVGVSDNLRKDYAVKVRK